MSDILDAAVYLHRQEYLIPRSLPTLPKIRVAEYQLANLCRLPAVIRVFACTNKTHEGVQRPLVLEAANDFTSEA